MDCDILEEDLTTLRCDKCGQELNDWYPDEDCYLTDCCNIGYYAYPQYHVYSNSLDGH